MIKGALRAALAATLLFVSAQAALAQPPPNVARTIGRVTAISGNEMTIATTQNPAQAVHLAPDWGVQVITPITMSAIQVGSFIGTANVPGPNGTGRSLEVHVFPPGVRMGEGDYDWDPGSRMTNGDVGRVTDTAEGRQIEVRYPGGVRTVTVPPNVPVTQLVPGQQSQVRVGSTVNVIGIRNADGSISTNFLGLLPSAPAAGQ